MSFCRRFSEHRKYSCIVYGIDEESIYLGIKSGRTMTILEKILWLNWFVRIFSVTTEGL